jgi:ABC-type transport system involved in cytochrome bd biosynthesis, ATPase and permease components
LVSGVFYPVEGEVNLFTNKVSYVSAYPMIIKGTLKENILYGAEKNKASDQKIKNLISKFELFENNNKNLDTKVSNKTLSSGQMQKLSFIRALLSNPELLLLDESTANLDKKTKKLIYKILKELNITILNSTHSSDDLEDFDFELSFSSVDGSTQITESKN